MDLQQKSQRHHEVSDGQQFLEESQQPLGKTNPDTTINKEELALLQIFPKSGTKTFLRRLKGWQDILKNFLTYVEAVVTVEKKRYTESVRLGNEYLGNIGVDKTKDANEDDVFSEFEMHQVVLKCLLDSDLQLNYNFTASLASIEKNITKGLKSLLQEVRRKCQESEKEWLGFDNELRKDESVYKKLRHELISANEFFNAHKSSKTPKHIPHDPYIIYSNLRRHVANCLMKREKYCDLVLEQQASFFGYEIDAILKPFYTCVTSFFQWRGNCSALSQEVYKKLLKMLDNPDYEKSWEAFVSNNRVYLRKHSMKPHPKKKSELAEDVDAFIVPSCSKVCYKAKIFKKLPPQFFISKPIYKQYLGMITTSGYFHIHPSDMENNRDTNCITLPELSIYLEDCTLTPITPDSFRPAGTFTLIERGSGLFVREVKHKFSSDSSASLNEWHSTINNAINVSPKLRGSTLVETNVRVDQSSEPHKVHDDSSSDTSISPSLKTASVLHEAPSLIESLSQRSNSTEIHHKYSDKKKKTSNFADFGAFKAQKEHQKNNDDFLTVQNSQVYLDTLGNNNSQKYPSTLRNQPYKSDNNDNNPSQLSNVLEDGYNVSESYEDQIKYNVDELVEPNPWGGGSYTAGDTLQ